MWWGRGCVWRIITFAGTATSAHMVSEGWGGGGGGGGGGGEKSYYAY